LLSQFRRSGGGIAQLLALGTAINLTFSSADVIAIVLTSTLARATRRIGLAERIIRLVVARCWPGSASH
jgi:threonine/homoserine/homoserine lactone efflux protein